MINDAIDRFLVVTDQGHEIYREYLLNRKSYFFAKRLFDNNLNKLQELEIIVSSKNSEFVDAAKILITHIKSWQSQWTKLKEETDPKDDDIFIFISTTPYPKEAESKFR